MVLLQWTWIARLLACHDWPYYGLFRLATERAVARIGEIPHVRPHKHDLSKN